MIDAPESGPRRSTSELEAVHRRLKTGRNKPCPCGSGRKYKTCCLVNDQCLARATPESFDMTQPDGAPLEEEDGDDTAWQQNLRLNRMLMHVASEAWQVNERPPGCTLRGLLLIWQAVATEYDRRPQQRATPSLNLLDSLAPAGMEERLVVDACPGVYGVNVSRARLYLDAQEVLLRCAERHSLSTAAATRRTAAELGRLRRELQRAA